MAPVIELRDEPALGTRLPATAACRHCGTPFRPTGQRPDFCCAGCQFVFRLISENGLRQFYELQESGAPPVGSLVFQKREYAWLEKLAGQAEEEPVAHLTLDVQGISCLGCAWLIEKLFSRHSGGLAISADPASGRLELTWKPGQFSPVDFARELQHFGYLLGPAGQARQRNRPLLIRLGLCGAIAMNTMLFTLPGYLGMPPDFEFASLFRRSAFFLGTLSVAIGGSYFFGRAWRSLRQGILHIDLPISLGLLAAYMGSVYAWRHQAQGLAYFDFVSTFTFLMLVGRWLQQQAVEANCHRLLSRQGLPESVRALETGAELPVTAISRGCTFSVAGGQTVPVRARLLSEAASVSLEWINGESDATFLPLGRIVPAGAVNCGAEAIRLEAQEPWEESLLAKLLAVSPVAAARHRGLERFMAIYIAVVLGLAGAGFAGWWMGTHRFESALQVFVSILVVSCPCASGIAIPLCTDFATLRMRRKGVFIRNADLWPKLARVRRIVFDKTGTLTAESITLRDPEKLASLSEGERSMLLTLVQDNPHPVCRCLSEPLLAGGARPVRAEPVRETVGLGLALRHAGAVWRLGRPEWAGSVGGETVFSRDGEALASFSFGEEPRADARSEVAALRRSGREIHVLSGDRRAKVAAMAQRLGMPARHALGELTPQEKAAWIRDHDHRDTLYLGDGANDSLAFDSAWCTGTPAIDRGLLEHKADFYFLGRDLSGVRALLETNALRLRTVRRVAGFAILYNLLAITLCFLGRMSPLLAAVLMPASSLLSLGIVLWAFRPRGAAQPN